MAASKSELLTPNQTSFVSGVPLKVVYKVARERLPAGLIVREGDHILFPTTAAVCVRIDQMLPRDVPVEVRKAFYAALTDRPQRGTLEHRSGRLTYVFDAANVAEEVAGELSAYREAMQVVREDPEVQAGAATFKGTRILTHTIADLLRAGATHEELKQDYPNLTDAMLAAAPIYARAHPRRGRPRRPRWREGGAAGETDA